MSPKSIKRICMPNICLLLSYSFNGDADLNKTLSELGLFGRHALIVVPRNRATVYPRAGSSSPNQTNSATGLGSSNKGNEGYFAFMKRIISYANPLSYLGGGASPSNSAQETQGNMWEYGEFVYLFSYFLLRSQWEVLVSLNKTKKGSLKDGLSLASTETLEVSHLILLGNAFTYPIHVPCGGWLQPYWFTRQRHVKKWPYLEGVFSLHGKNTVVIMFHIHTIAKLKLSFFVGMS